MFRSTSACRENPQLPLSRRQVGEGVKADANAVKRAKAQRDVGW